MDDPFPGSGLYVILVSAWYLRRGAGPNPQVACTAQHKFEKSMKNSATGHTGDREPSVTKEKSPSAGLPWSGDQGRMEDALRQIHHGLAAPVSWCTAAVPGPRSTAAGRAAGRLAVMLCANTCDRGEYVFWNYG